MRSFSSAAKAEICQSIPKNNCCLLAECFGILLFCNSFRHNNIKIITESPDFSGILPKLFSRAFGFGFDVQSGDGQNGKFVFQILSQEKLNRIMEIYGFDSRESLSLHINLPVVENDCCKMSFLRGAFLSGGSVTAPEKGYHMEFATTHQSVAREFYALVQESMGFAPKIAARNGDQVVYLKQSEQISDFLAQLGASVAYMGLLEARLERELNNKVNRRVNCDDANITKVVEASRDHLNAIRVLRDNNRFESLPEKLKNAAIVREENPEASLAELAELVEPPISKPAMNHRLKRLIAIAAEGNK